MFLTLLMMGYLVYIDLSVNGVCELFVTGLIDVVSRYRRMGSRVLMKRKHHNAILSPSKTAYKATYLLPCISSDTVHSTAYESRIFQYPEDLEGVPESVVIQRFA